MSKFTAAVILISLFLSGCAAALPRPLPDHKTPVPHSVSTPLAPTEPTATEITGVGGLPGGALAAQADLAQMLRLPRNNVIIQFVQASQFSDSCLGLGGPNESCLQQATYGFVVVMQADGVEYAYHTNTDGTTVRLVQNLPTDAGQAVEVARVILAGQLGLGDPTQIQVVDVIAVAWPDACLGVSSAGTACAEVITPGFRILLAAEGGLYEFHSNLDGTQIIQVETQ